MDIKTIGINYEKAGIDIREKFTFTNSEKERAICAVKETEGILGCVILGTCNRTELWVQTTPDADISLSGLLCGLKQVNEEEYGQYLEVREGYAAVQHLFYLASGLKSQILGEDQILTQVGDAIAQSREYGCSNAVLEVLFRMAVTAGKEIKTRIALPKGNSSAPLAAIQKLEQEGHTFAGKRCLVVGNGMMGKLTAGLLMERGADVTVTIRQYRSGRVEIPRGAKRIDYGERYGFLPECDYVFSATASPNITIKRERLEESGTKKNQIFVDLAVPRDIEISVGELENITLYDIDSFHMEVVSEETKELLGQAEGLLREKIQEYVSWYEAKDAVPMLLEISRQAAEDVVWRLGGPLAQAESAQRERLEQSIEASVQKVVNKLMFGIRDSLDAETFRDCLTAIQKLYENKEAP